ncbi:hypothetical protein C8Q76DRAFT_708156 [Earliella scabrosa]|nr:hypothetical protein C8Q76DRAFT_708156 [Earliella scabrosa]
MSHGPPSGVSRLALAAWPLCCSWSSVTSQCAQRSALYSCIRAPEIAPGSNPCISSDRIDHLYGNTRSAISPAPEACATIL